MAFTLSAITSFVRGIGATLTATFADGTKGDVLPGTFVYGDTGTPLHVNADGSLAAAGGTAATDGSSTITLGGTAQNLFNAAIPAHGWSVANPDATEDLWVSDTVTAIANGVGCYRVAPNGGTVVTPPNMAPAHAVSTSSERPDPAPTRKLRRFNDISAPLYSDRQSATPSVSQGPGVVDGCRTGPDRWPRMPRRR